MLLKDWRQKIDKKFGRLKISCIFKSVNLVKVADNVERMCSAALHILSINN